MHAQKWCSNHKNRFQRASFFGFEQHSERLETVSVALQLDNFDELDKNTTAENPLLPDSNADSIEARQHTASAVCKEVTTSDSHSC